MAGSGDTNEYKDPFGVTYDDESDHVKVMVVIPSLKKAFAKNEPSGGKVDFKVEDRSFDLKLSMMSKESGVKKLHHYRYHVKLLPAGVIPGKCEYKVKDTKVIIKLYKAKLESWQATLSDTGLETYDEDEPEKKDS